MKPNETKPPREFWLLKRNGQPWTAINRDNIASYEQDGYEPVHVVEAIALEQAKAEIAELRFELEAKQRPLGEQVLELTIERDELKAEYEAYQKIAVAENANTVEQRDSHEEYLNRIADKLGDNTEWSNLNHRGDRALDLIDELHNIAELRNTKLLKLGDTANELEHWAIHAGMYAGPIKKIIVEIREALGKK